MMRRQYRFAFYLLGMLAVVGLGGCVSQDRSQSSTGGDNGDTTVTVNSEGVKVKTDSVSVNINGNGNNNGHRNNNGNGNNFGNASTQVTEEIQKEFNADKVNSLRVVDQLGSIEIAPAEGANTIRIEAKKVVQGSQSEEDLKPLLSKIQPTARLEGDVLVVEANIPQNGFPEGTEGLVHYVITVPHRLSVDLHTENSPITVRGVSGGVTALTSNGAIELFDISGALNATSTNSPIRLDRATMADHMNLTTTNGEISCENVHAAGKALKVALSSTNAPVHFAGDVSDLKIETLNGNIEAEPTDHLVFENGSLVTSNGPITLTVPSSFSASIQTETTNATIRTVGMNDSSDTGYAESASRTIVMGKQYAPVHLETSNGNITVEVKH